MEYKSVNNAVTTNGGTSINGTTNFPFRVRWTTNYKKYIIYTVTSEESQDKTFPDREFQMKVYTKSK